MRKVFGGSLVFSLVGVALLGGIFAWNYTATVTGENQVGTGDFSLEYNQAGAPNLLGPDGNETFVGGGGGGTTGDFVLEVAPENMQVEITNATGNDGTCTVNMFEGRADTLSGGVEIDDPGYNPGDWEFRVFILTHDATTAMNSSNPFAVPASPACQGGTVSYEISITATTTGELIDQVAYVDENEFFVP